MQEGEVSSALCQQTAATQDLCEKPDPYLSQSWYRAGGVRLINQPVNGMQGVSCMPFRGQVVDEGRKTLLRVLCRGEELVFKAFQRQWGCVLAAVQQIDEEAVGLAAPLRQPATWIVCVQLTQHGRHKGDAGGFAQAVANNLCDKRCGHCARVRQRQGREPACGKRA